MDHTVEAVSRRTREHARDSALLALVKDRALRALAKDRALFAPARERALLALQAAVERCNCGGSGINGIDFTLAAASKRPESV